MEGLSVIFTENIQTLTLQQCVLIASLFIQPFHCGLWMMNGASSSSSLPPTWPQAWGNHPRRMQNSCCTGQAKVHATIHTLFLTLMYTILTTTPSLTHFSHIHVHYSHNHSTSDSFLSHLCTLFSQLLHFWLTSLTNTPLWLIVLTYYPYLRIVYIQPDTRCKYPT